MATKLTAENFVHIPDESEVRISIVSDESIHIHNVFGEIQTTFGQLRQDLLQY